MGHKYGGKSHERDSGLGCREEMKLRKRSLFCELFTENTIKKVYLEW